MVTLEIAGVAAECQTCGERFDAVSEKDLIHRIDSMGQECYGIGKLLAFWGRVKKVV